MYFSPTFLLELRDHSKTLGGGGGTDAKRLIAKIFQGPPSDLKKCQDLPFCMKIMG